MQELTRGRGRHRVVAHQVIDEFRAAEAGSWTAHQEPKRVRNVHILALWLKYLPKIKMFGVASASVVIDNWPVRSISEAVDLADRMRALARLLVRSAEAIDPAGRGASDHEMLVLAHKLRLAHLQRAIAFPDLNDHVAGFGFDILLDLYTAGTEGKSLSQISSNTAASNTQVALHLFVTLYNLNLIAKKPGAEPQALFVLSTTGRERTEELLRFEYARRVM